eukprot:7394334-Pyramimonas_sp.AAC.1
MSLRRERELSGGPAGIAGVPAGAVGPAIMAVIIFNYSRRSLSSLAPRNISSRRFSATCSSARAQ